MFKFYARICSVAVVMLMVFTAGYSSGAENFASERAGIRTSWLNATRVAVQKIKDHQADEVLQFIEKNAILGAPNEKGVMFIEGAQTDSWFTIVPLLKNDKSVSKNWKMIFEISTAAHFLPKVRSVVLKDYIPYSLNGKALVLLHEGYHAEIFMKNTYEGKQSDRDYCYEEVKVHTFQNKVMSLIGGKKYQAILDKEVGRISAVANMAEGDFSVPSRTEYDEGLTEALGKPASQLEKDFIQTSVWIHAVFTFLDNKFKGDSDEQKALFLRSMYKDGGIL